jgi:hypothetical protein
MPVAMPRTAVILADKKRLLGKAHVAECFRRGMAGEPGWFFAREGPLAIGTPWDQWADLLQVFSPTAGQALVILKDPEPPHGP